LLPQQAAAVRPRLLQQVKAGCNQFEGGLQGRQRAQGTARHRFQRQAEPPQHIHQGNKQGRAEPGSCSQMLGEHVPKGALRHHRIDGPGRRHDLSQRVPQLCCVLGVDGQHDLLQRPGLAPVEPADRAAVKQGDPTVLGQEEVARVRVSVEGPNHQELVQEAPEQPAAQRLPSLGPQRRRGIRQPGPLDPVHNQDPGSRQTGGRPGDDEPPMPPDGIGHRVEVAGLGSEVQLAGHVVRKGLRHLRQTQIPSLLRAALQPRGQPPHDLQIGPHPLADLRALDLDGNRGAVSKDRAMHLRQRRRRHRFSVEGGKAL
jgi:hypothetical protein